MGGAMSDAQVAVGVRAVALASAFLVRTLRDSQFLATAAGETAPGIVEASTETAVVEGDRRGRLKSLARRGGELARQGGEYARQGLDRWVSTRPGTPAWKSASREQRCDWWFANLGRATAVLAALPGLTGAASDRVPVRELLSAAGQGLLLVAIAVEYGIEDTEDHVSLIGEVLFGRRLDLAAPRDAAVAAQEAEALAGGAKRADSTRRTQAAALVRIGRTLTQLEAELDKRPQGHRGLKLMGSLPGVGVIGHYKGERHGLGIVSDRGRAWCVQRLGRRAFGAAAPSPTNQTEQPAMPSALVPPAGPRGPRVIAGAAFADRVVARRALSELAGSDSALIQGAAVAAWLTPGDGVLEEVVLAVTPIDVRVVGRAGIRPRPAVWTFAHHHLARDVVQWAGGPVDFAVQLPDGRWLGIRLMNQDDAEAVRAARATARAGTNS